MVSNYQLRVWTKLKTNSIFFFFASVALFFSFREESVKKYTGKSDPIAVMGYMRQDKDKFRAKR